MITFFLIIKWFPVYTIQRAEKRGCRSRFTKNKTALSQFMKHIILAFHVSQRNIKENILENHAVTMEITIHKQKTSHFSFHGK